MPHLDRLGAGSRGVWTREQASGVLSPGRIDAQTRSGAWQTVWRGVYADAGYVLDAEQRAWAAVLASGGAHQPFGPADRRTGERRRRVCAVACGRTAARVHGIPLIDDDDPATGAHEAVLEEVAVRRARRDVRYRGRTLTRRQLALRPGDAVRLRSGLWVTSPVRTLLDCACVLTHDAMVCAVDGALQAGLVTAEQLHDAACRRRGDVGAPAFRQALALADGRAEAPSETLARLVLLPHLPALRPQVELRNRAGRLVARFDLGDDEVRLAVEADGKRRHAGMRMVAHDQRRDRMTARLGWWTERATWFELRRQPDEVRGRVVAKHAELRASRRHAS